MSTCNSCARIILVIKYNNLEYFHKAGRWQAAIAGRADGKVCRLEPRSFGRGHTHAVETLEFALGAAKTRTVGDKQGNLSRCRGSFTKG